VTLLAKKGILLISHGSPILGETDALFAIAHEVQRRLPESITEVAFLDFNEPRIEEGVKRIMEHEISELILVPYFLSNGFLAKKALHRAKKAANIDLRVPVRCADPIGYDERLLDVIKERIEAVKFSQEFEE
jgi:sirohydrochlorin ferrochelatase